MEALAWHIAEIQIPYFHVSNKHAQGFFFLIIYVVLCLPITQSEDLLFTSSPYKNVYTSLFPILSKYI